MELKKNIKEIFSDNDKIILERYKASRSVFIFIAFLFFLNFYLVGGGFYENLLIYPLGFLYILLLISLYFYFYFIFKKLIKNFYLKVFISIILLGIFGFLSLIIILKGGFNGIMELYRLYFKI